MKLPAQLSRARSRARVLIGALIACMGLLLAALAPANAADGLVSGTVTEAGSGVPIEGVSVQFFCWQVTGSDRGELCGEAQTANDGGYASSLAPGTYKVFFDHFPAHRSQYYGGGTTSASPDSLDVVVSSGGSVSGIDASLVPLRTVSGTVTGDGDPLTGINVTAYQQEGGPGTAWRSIQSTVSGTGGSYALHLAAGTYRVGFSDGSGPYRTIYYDGAGTVEAAADLVVAGVDLTGIDADLASNYAITGAVIVDHVPMQGVAVTAWQRAPEASDPLDWEAVKSTITDPDGRYALFLPDGTYRVEFRTWQARFPTTYYDGASTLDAAADVVLGGADVPNIDAVIVGDAEDGPAITGTVSVEGTGEPAAGVSVSAYRWNVLFSTWQIVKESPTGPDGSYTLSAPEGTYRIGFSHPTGLFQPTFYGGDSLDMAADLELPTEGLQGIDAQVPASHRISGVITADPVDGLPPGTPPTVVTAFRWDDGQAAWVRVSDGFAAPDGRYEVYVPDGTYRIGFSVFHDQYLPLYYDGVDNIADGTDVTVSGGDVGPIDAHLVAESVGSPPTWPAAATLSAAGQHAWAPDVAVGSDGTATAVWSRTDGGISRVQAATGAVDRSWSAPVNLSPAGGAAMDPQVGAGTKGTAVAVWREWDGTHHRARAARRAEDGGWSAATDLSAPGGDIWDPRVAMSEKGTAVAVWRLSEAGTSRVQVATLAKNGRWSAPESLSIGDAWDPQLAIGPGGAIVAAWSEYDGAHYRVHVSRRTAHGPWSQPLALSEPAADAWSPHVAAGPKGTAAVVWRRWDGASDRVEAALRTSAGGWSSPEAISSAGRDAHDPQVAVHPEGDVTAVWARWDGSDDRVQAASWSSGGAWSAPAHLSRAGRNAGDPQVAAGPDGRATVVWRQANGPAEQALASVRSPEGTWSKPARISAAGPRTYGPAVAAGPDGTAAAVWEQRVGDVDRVQGVVRTDPPGQHCTNAHGVDLNVLFGVRESIIDGPCATALVGSTWRPLSLWVTNSEFAAFPPGFMPAGATPLEDLVAKLTEVKVVINGGTDRKRTITFSPTEALRIDRNLAEYDPRWPAFPMAASIPAASPLSVGEHTVRVVWTLSDRHCDGFSDMAEVSCLDRGNNPMGTKHITVVSR